MASEKTSCGKTVEYDLGKTALYGIQFKPQKDFEGIEVHIGKVLDKKETSVRASLYAWKKNYSTSVQGEPLTSQVFSGFERDTWIGVKGKYPQGEYLLVLDEANAATVNVIEEKCETVNSYLHTSKAGITIENRVLGCDKLGAVTQPLPQEYITDDATTWVGKDGLDRTLPTEAQTGGERREKYVGIFYHTWHDLNAPRANVLNVTKTVAQYPESKNDYDHPVWQGYTTFFWNEPLYGYYNNGVDRWVLRRHAELLANAGVDVVIFDNTNGTENFMRAIFTLLEVWAEARADGVKTPQISCQLNMFEYDRTAIQLIELYDKIYAKGLYQDLWFYWEGKPLMVGYAEELKAMNRMDVYEFFTYRPIKGTYSATSNVQVINEDGSTIGWDPPKPFEQYSQWKWISIYPQEIMKNVKTGENEAISVSVAQNWSKRKGLTTMNAEGEVFGRGYTDKYGYDASEYAITHGLNFQEQWEYALSVDPKFIFVTGWNEWIAGRWREMWGDKNAIPDNALDGFSRDAEPSKGVLKDHFYNQLIANIRRFKGCKQIEKAEKIEGGKGIDWAQVKPVYRAYKGNTFSRDCQGYRYKDEWQHYQNATGRNDIVESRVAFDDDNVYFMVQTRADITPYTDRAWMRLLIDVEGVEETPSNNWETYEYIVNRESPTKEKAVLEKSTGGWHWEKVGEIDYQVEGRRLYLTVPRALLKIEKAPFTLNFKWSDNMQEEGDVMDFYSHGDVAPTARLKYRFTTK